MCSSSVPVTNEPKEIQSLKEIQHIEERKSTVAKDELPPQLADTRHEVATIFLSNLAENVTEDILYDVFSCCGKILDIRIRGDKQLARNQRYELRHLTLFTPHTVSSEGGLHIWTLIARLQLQRQ